MTKKTEYDLRKINDTFDATQGHMLQAFGDEANDIGDAANAVELVANTCLHHTHDAYTPAQASDFIATRAGLTQNEMQCVINEMREWTQKEWKEAVQAF